MALKFTMRQKTASGYEPLYPKTIPGQVITDENNRFVSDNEKNAWNNAEPAMTELDDIAICCGNFNNAAAGWCSFSFPREFDGVPAVNIQPVSVEGIVLLNNVTPQGFQYQVRVPATGSYYTAAGTAASTTHSAQTLMTGFATTADAVELSYIAVYDGDTDD